MTVEEDAQSSNTTVKMYGTLESVQVGGGSGSSTVLTCKLV